LVLHLAGASGPLAREPNVFAPAKAMTVAERVKGRRRAGVLQPPSPEEANWFPLGGGGAAMPGPVADENQANGGT